MTSVLTDEQVVVDIDMDATVPCNLYADVQCPRAAEWIYLCPGCGEQSMPCTPCRQESDAEDARMEAVGVTDWFCTKCDTRVPTPTPWRPI